MTLLWWAKALPFHPTGQPGTRLMLKDHSLCNNLFNISNKPIMLPSPHSPTISTASTLLGEKTHKINLTQTLEKSLKRYNKNLSQIIRHLFPLSLEQKLKEKKKSLQKCPLSNINYNEKNTITNTILKKK